MTTSPKEYQLRETCRLTGAAWAAQVSRVSGGWTILVACGMKKRQAAALTGLLEKEDFIAWVGGAVSSARRRERSASRTPGLGVQRLYLFPNPFFQGLLVIGADRLGPDGIHFWRILAASSFQELTAGGLLAGLPDMRIGMSDSLGQALEKTLQTFREYVPCDGGWLAIRQGDLLTIKAEAGCAAGLDYEFALDSNSLVRKALQTRSGLIVQRGSLEWTIRPLSGEDGDPQHWALFPLMISQRLIAMTALWREAPFNLQEQETLSQLSVRLASSVEENIAFANLSEHLRRLGLLNDFVLTVSSAIEPGQIPPRVFGLLKRAFQTEMVILSMLAPDGQTLQQYEEREGRIALHSMPVSSSLLYRSLEKGNNIRVEDFSQHPGLVRVYEDAASALLAPIKFRGQLTGVLGLESARVNAFSVYDEHLLVVIASHLAGLVENSRLRQEAEARAHNLEFIHQVVQRILGQTDEGEIARITTELIARNSAFDFVGVLLVNPISGGLSIAGIAGKAGNLVREALRYSSMEGKEGITGQVFQTGESMLVNDVSKNVQYKPLPGWNAGSELCIALRDGSDTLGVIDVECQRKGAFLQNDRLVLESLAGVLASVISSARRYRQLQHSIHELQAARVELQQRIEAQRMAESRLFQAAKMAAVGEMAAGIAHELNNPLTTVAGFTELAIEGLEQGSSRRADLELVLREAQRARSVVRRMLDFSRQSESVQARADMNEVVSDVLALVGHLSHTSGVEIRTDLAEQLPWVLMDRNQIKQVLLNLVHNALHAMPRGGELALSTLLQNRDGRDWVIVRVMDTGIGIPEDNLDRIFEPFFTTRNQEGGTGLGLSVSYGIVADHGGSIDVESKVGQGSVFSVWMPVQEEE
ncbi:MAG: GAF domain-containing protein [Chloroflexi bacterium]|nr:GAF domain-containing protein [Chloroflexota bacterium]